MYLSSRKMGDRRDQLTKHVVLSMFGGGIAHPNWTVMLKSWPLCLHFLIEKAASIDRVRGKIQIGGWQRCSEGS